MLKGDYFFVSQCLNGTQKAGYQCLKGTLFQLGLRKNVDVISARVVIIRTVETAASATERETCFSTLTTQKHSTNKIVFYDGNDTVFVFIGGALECDRGWEFIIPDDDLIVVENYVSATSSFKEEEE